MIIYTPSQERLHSSQQQQQHLRLTILLLLTVASPVSSLLGYSTVVGANTGAATHKTRGVVEQRLRRLPLLHAENDDKANKGETSSFILPIFPLRKSIKLPGETLTLNLYEERYLAMAEWILLGTTGARSSRIDTRTNSKSNASSLSSSMMFGALYASDKPQIVSDAGMGPIVPMLRVGDVGVVFPVEHHQQDMVETRGGVDRCRRIRIVGTGVARFQIERILHNGYGGGDLLVTEESTHTDKVQPLPFVLAQVRLYTDQNSDNENDHGTSINNDDDDDDDALLNNLPLTKERIGVLSERATILGIPHRVMQAEFKSFLRASAALGEGVSLERKTALESQSTSDRQKRTLLRIKE